MVEPMEKGSEPEITIFLGGGGDVVECVEERATWHSQPVWVDDNRRFCIDF